MLKKSDRSAVLPNLRVRLRVRQRTVRPPHRQVDEVITANVRRKSFRRRIPPVVRVGVVDERDQCVSTRSDHRVSIQNANSNSTGCRDRCVRTSCSGDACDAGDTDAGWSGRASHARHAGDAGDTLHASCASGTNTCRSGSARYAGHAGDAHLTGNTDVPRSDRP